MPLGLSDSLSGRGWGFPSFLLESDGRYILVDCPADIIQRLNGIGLNPLDISHVLITHHHDDHTAGLISFLTAQKYLRLFFDTYASIGSVREGQVVHDLSVHYCGGDLRWYNHFKESLVIHHLSDVPLSLSIVMDGVSQLNLLDNSVTVDLRPTKHSAKCKALRFNDSIGISADTSFDPELIEWLNKAGIIFHECGMGGPHTKITELDTLPKDILDKVNIYHMPDIFIKAWHECPPLVALSELRWYEGGKDF